MAPRSATTTLLPGMRAAARTIRATTPTCSSYNHSRAFYSQATRATSQRPGRRRTDPAASLAMSGGSRAAHSAPSAQQAKKKPPPMEPRPSASVVILSPTNQVLLLHRVSTSSAFPSAHVFPGGNLSEFHDGAVAPPGDPRRHDDSLAYRLAAVRETFEESGILLALESGGSGGGGGRRLLELPAAARDSARRAIHADEVGFAEWLASVGGVADTAGLVPFTRWVTPAAQARRFSTQMYLYMLPSEAADFDAGVDAPLAAAQRAEAITPTPDGGAEITAARFDDAGAWLALQRGRGSGGGGGDDGNGSRVVMFPPQCFLLHLLSGFLTGGPGPASASEAESHYRAQREREREQLRGFLAAVPTSTTAHPTAQIPWGEKVISPVALGWRRDGKAILGLDKPGLPELASSGRGGDWERVVLVRWVKGQARDIEVRGRQEVLAEQREAEKLAGASSSSKL